MQILMIARSPMMDECHMHAHDNWELILNLLGEGKEVVGEEQHRFSPGTITLCPPNVSHNKYVASGERWQDIYIRFADPLLEFPKQTVVFADDAAHMVEQVVGLLLHLFHQQGRDAPIIQQLSDVLCTLLIERIQPIRHFSVVTERINHAIVQHYTDAGFDLTQVLLQQNYADGHIRRLYRRDMKQTPRQHLMLLRLEHAKQLLQLKTTPRYTIQEVALLSGFDDANYFSRAFGRVYGMTPSAYRKRQDENTN